MLGATIELGCRKLMKKRVMPGSRLRAFQGEGTAGAKSPAAGKCLAYSRGSKEVLMKVRTYIYSNVMPKLASVYGIINSESSGGIMQK